MKLNWHVFFLSNLSPYFPTVIYMYIKPLFLYYKIWLDYPLPALWNYKIHYDSLVNKSKLIQFSDTENLKLLEHIIFVIRLIKILGGRIRSISSHPSYGHVTIISILSYPLFAIKSSIISDFSCPIFSWITYSNFCYIC